MLGENGYISFLPSLRGTISNGIAKIVYIIVYIKIRERNQRNQGSLELDW